MSDPVYANPAITLAHPLPTAPHGDKVWWDHVGAWQGHVQAGRIGSGGGIDAAELERIRHNEAVVLGWTPSFPAAVPVRVRGR